MKFPSRNSLPVFRRVRSHHSLNHLECGYLKSKRAWSALASPWRITITSAWRSLCQTKYPEAAPPSVAQGHSTAARRLARLWLNLPAPARGTQRTRICGYHPNRRHRIGIVRCHGSRLEQPVPSAIEEMRRQVHVGAPSLLEVSRRVWPRFVESGNDPPLRKAHGPYFAVHKVGPRPCIRDGRNTIAKRPTTGFSRNPLQIVVVPAFDFLQSCRAVHCKPYSKANRGEMPLPEG